jgi:hypothetical protein
MMTAKSDVEGHTILRGNSGCRHGLAPGMQFGVECGEVAIHKSCCDSGRLRVGILGSLVLDTATGPTQVGGARLRALLARLVLERARLAALEDRVEAELALGSDLDRGGW